MIEIEIYSEKYCMNQICEENLIEPLLINYLEENQYRNARQLGNMVTVSEEWHFGNYSVQGILEGISYSQKLRCRYDPVCPEQFRFISCVLAAL